MSSRTEWDVRNSPSNRPCMVWNKRSLTTQCANPQCSKELLYLREGRLALLDMESHANDQPRPDDGAFAMRLLSSRLFWLCGECTKTYVVKRWTTAGLVVMPRNPTVDNNPDLVDRLSELSKLAIDRWCSVDFIGPTAAGTRHCETRLG
jgi:hypothetical protein